MSQEMSLGFASCIFCSAVNMQTVTLTAGLQNCALMKMMPDVQDGLHDMHPDLTSSYKSMCGPDWRTESRYAD